MLTSIAASSQQTATQNADNHPPVLASQPEFQQIITPFVKKSCSGCHNAKLMSGGLNLTSYQDETAVLKDRDVWEKVVSRLHAGEMPPKGVPRPKPEEVERVIHWVESQFAEVDRKNGPDPGRLTAHRLNRTEYNNTVRDLLAVDFNPAEDFPADDSGYGFDNIGDVLSVSPVLMEKYLAAAGKIAKVAIPLANEPLPKPTRSRFSPDRPKSKERLLLEYNYKAPTEGDYALRTAVGGQKEAFQIHLMVDGKEVHSSDVLIEKEKPREYETRVHIPYGQHAIKVFLTRREATTEELKTAAEIKTAKDKAFQKLVAKYPNQPEVAKKQWALQNPPVYVDLIELQGPFNPLPPPIPESYSRIFICGHPRGKHTASCARKNLAPLARLAYRRPVTREEVNRLVRLVPLAQKEGLSFEEGMRLAVQAMLVSPNFLYRFQQTPASESPEKVYPVNEYELASRLSYFLWSSMPDEDLMQLADRHQLRKPEVLKTQVHRMLKDPKSNALVENFAGQWLELRNLESVSPDPDEFPEFDDELRKAMRTETQMFFSAILREDRSILDFLDGKYTFVNERLAEFYGIPGVRGEQFRRVDLPGTERSGVLTQASVLTVTSYPTRTSAVLRGKWILENFLNAPPPPPPPGVGSLDEKGAKLTGTMRQQLEKHRANPTCASCHARMDPLGFSLENYNAIGHWRTKDGEFPIDTTGVLPNGKSFNGPAEMKTILRTNSNAFAECLTEKMLTYALGRGLERYDRSSVKKITGELTQNNYRISNLILGIVTSLPFQMGRDDSGTRGAATE